MSPGGNEDTDLDTEQWRLKGSGGGEIKTPDLITTYILQSCQHVPKNNTANNLVSALAAPVSTTFRTKLIMFSVPTLCLKGCHYILLVPVSAAPQGDRASSLLPTSYGVHEGSKSHVLN